MKKNYLLIISTIFIFIPNLVFADTNEKIISEEIKYFRTTTNYSNNDIFLLNSVLSNSYTEEISEEEYLNSDYSLKTSVSGSVENTYKKLVTSIIQNGSKYKYKVQLIWKSLPSKRSYDIIGIGHYSNVKVSGKPTFQLVYGSNSTSNATIKKTSTGTTATFKLPTGSFNNLTATLYFDVEKNTNSNILTQKAFGDYSHATSTISESNANKHTINTSGIKLDTSIINNYDEINTAVATWTGNW